MSAQKSYEKDTLEYKLQNKEYVYPYHHFPHMDAWRGHSFPSMDTYLYWGFEYLAYNMHIIDKIVEHKCKKVLDFGCGDGKFLQLLADNRGPKADSMDLYGIDISEEAIQLAKCMNVHAKVRYEAVDIADVDDLYECISCIEVLEHIPDDVVPIVLQQIYRCLMPGGMAIISVPSTNRPKAEKHFRHYDANMIRRMVDDSAVPFQIKSLKYFWKKNALKKYLLFTTNRFMYIRFRLLDNALWKRSFRANEKNGAHIIVELEKPLR